MADPGEAARGRRRAGETPAGPRHTPRRMGTAGRAPPRGGRRLMRLGLRSRSDRRGHATSAGARRDILGPATVLEPEQDGLDSRCRTQDPLAQPGNRKPPDGFASDTRLSRGDAPSPCECDYQQPGEHDRGFASVVAARSVAIRDPIPHRVALDELDVRRGSVKRPVKTRARLRRVQTAHRVRAPAATTVPAIPDRVDADRPV
jgi:hypothetical protein